MRTLVVALVLVRAATAHADHFADNLATYVNVDPSNVREVQAYRFPEGMEYSDVIIGRYVEKDVVSTAVILERCNPKQCTAQFASITPNQTIEVLGLVDLAGAPGPFPDVAIRASRSDAVLLKTPAHMAHPALVLRHGETRTTTSKTYTMHDVTGDEVHQSITLLSLDHGRTSPTIFSISVADHHPNGVGQHTMLRFDRSGKTGMLSIIAKQQREIFSELACIPPKPTETSWHLDKDRYVESALVPSHGCG